MYSACKRTSVCWPGPLPLQNALAPWHAHQPGHCPDVDARAQQVTVLLHRAVADPAYRRAEKAFADGVNMERDPTMCIPSQAVHQASDQASA